MSDLTKLVNKHFKVKPNLVRIITPSLKIFDLESIMENIL